MSIHPEQGIPPSSSTTENPGIQESPRTTPGNLGPVPTHANASTKECSRPTDLKSTPSYKNELNVSQKELVNKRFNQWRRFSRDPYQPPNELAQEEEPPRSSRRVRHPGSEWTHLFYDLAWTATFATLSQNGKFDEPTDYASYLAFFAVVWWLWTSQAIYTVNFYTNDWFHLISIFLQLFIFGALAATTNGYEITAYITHLPGAGNLNPDTSGLGDEEELERFAVGRTYSLSACALALALASTRLIHLAQYVRVWIYATWGKGVQTPARRYYLNWGRFIFDRAHPQIYGIIIGLVLSNASFLAVVGIVFSNLRTTKQGATLKISLWGVGFFVEILSHFWYPAVRRVNYYRVMIFGTIEDASNFQSGNAPDSAPRNVKNTGGARLDESSKTAKEAKATGWVKIAGWTKSAEGANTTEGANPLPLVGVNLIERFDTITTIILGEGINGFAGTLTSILTSPGTGKLIGVNVASAAFTIWFIAYIYFEGPASTPNPKGEGLRLLFWMFTYLPFLASIFLLFVGIKNQFLLTATLSTATKTMDEFMLVLNQTGFYNNFTDPAFRSNAVLKEFLFARGIIWSEEYDDLMNGANLQNKTEWRQRVTAWIFNKEQGIPGDIQSRINAYNNISDPTVPNQDFDNRDPRTAEFYQILTQLLHGSLQGARYILVFAAVILICLGVQSMIHSPLHDRYQWRVIITRITMGIVLALLMLLNLGKYQEFYVPKDLKGQRAGVFLWLEAFWVLPTIALAYGVQFIFEVTNALLAKRATVAALAKNADQADHEVGHLPDMPYRAPVSPIQNEEKEGDAGGMGR